jgi:sRNA-binding regulator protein Hfq
MSKIGVWTSDQDKKKGEVAKTKPKKQSAEKDFWDNCISEKRMVTFRLRDTTEIAGKLLAYDNYFLLIEIDGKQRLVHKGALFWVE